MIELRCPHCRRYVPAPEHDGDCAHCARTLVSDGVAHCGLASEYWGEVPQRVMQQINDLCEQHPWSEAVRRILRDAYPDIYVYVSSDSRADWHFALPIDKSKAMVLDVGSGWGPVTFSLARVFRFVVSLEGVAERIAFQNIRRRQDAVTNIRLVRGNLLDEVFPREATFDAVSMNGVLEWIGLADKHRNPADVQRAALEYIRALLKPGGVLYVGIENRTGGNMFLGTRDHSGLRFTSLMPRRLASLYMSLLHRDGYTEERRTETALQQYRTYTYTYWGYKKLLRSAGFDDVTIFQVLPSYSWPRFIIPLDSETQIGYFLSHFSSAQKWKDRVLIGMAKMTHLARLSKLFAPDFMIVARKT